MDETYIRVGGWWCYLWRAVDQFGQLIDFRRAARRNAKAARTVPRQARKTIRHVDRKDLNNRVESGHAALKQRLRLMRRSQALAGANAPRAGIETFCTIRKGQFENCKTGIANEINFVAKLFPEVA